MLDRRYEQQMDKKEKRQFEKEKLKEMSGRQKLEYLWMYYKVWLLVPIGIALLVWVGVTMYRSKTEEVLLNVVMLEIHGNMTTNYVKLQGLAPEGIYEEEGTGRRYTGRALMAAGLPMPIELGEYLAYQMYFRRVE